METRRERAPLGEHIRIISRQNETDKTSPAGSLATHTTVSVTQGAEGLPSWLTGDLSLSLSLSLARALPLYIYTHTPTHTHT